MRLLMSADTVGGVWDYSLELARGLCAGGDQVLLATLGLPSEAQREAAGAIPGLTLAAGDYPLEWMPEPWAGLAEAGEWLLGLAAGFAPDVVHLNHYCHGHLDWPAPSVVIAHSCVYSWYEAVHGRSPERRWQAYRRAIGQGLQGTDWVVAPTHAMRQALVHHYGAPRRCSVIYNGRSGEDYAPAAKEPVILAAGRLWDEAKNITALVRVAPRLSWPVLIAGEARRPGGGEVELSGARLLGSLPAPQLAEQYARAAIYCLPARYEPFGLSVLEAALSGCALVLGDIPSLRELWDGAAVFVPPQDEPALARALGRLIANPDRCAELGARARARAGDYSSERLLERYRQLYRWLTEAAAANQQKEA